MEDPAEPRRGIVAALKRLLGTALDIAHNRLELLLVELHEERYHFFGALLLVGVVLVCGLMAALVFTGMFAIYCVQTDRVWLLGVLGTVYVGGGAAAYFRLRNRLKKWEPFAGTLSEIKKDKSCLDELK